MTTTNPETTSPTTRTTPAELRAWRQAFLGFMQAAALVLAARMILLISVLIAGLLALRALDGGPMQLGAVGLFTATVVLPLVLLAGKR